MILHPVQFGIGVVFAAVIAVSLWYGFFYDEFRDKTTRRDNPIAFWSIMALFAINAIVFTFNGLGAMDK